jgi:hypothetical protein
VSGRLTYSIFAGHVYQRKFANDELAQALKGFHLYIVSRRPATRIDERSIRQLGELTSLEMIVFNPADRSVRERLPLDIAWGIQSATFRTHMDGSYFSVCSKDGELLHGDAWALATSILGAPRGIADQEVLYVGQAYGQEGERSAYDRTREHNKVQRIYEEHAGEAWDIFISPVTISETNFNNWDHLPDDGQGFELDAIFALAGNKRTRTPTPKLSVDLVEHALITTFQPPYNVNLIKWAPSDPTMAMRKVRDWGFRLMSVTLDGIDGMARYYTTACPSRDRGLTRYFGLTEIPKRPELNPLDPASWDYVMQIHVRAMSRFANMAEMSDVILHWFGRSAPALRKPPEILFE